MSYLESLRSGIQAAKSGKRMLARVQFEHATEIDSHCPHGWLWSAWAADSPAQALECVEIALTRSPGHPLASKFLEVLQALQDYEFKACGTPSCKSTCQEVCGLEWSDIEDSSSIDLPVLSVCEVTSDASCDVATAADLSTDAAASPLEGLSADEMRENAPTEEAVRMWNSVLDLDDEDREVVDPTDLDDDELFDEQSEEVTLDGELDDDERVNAANEEAVDCTDTEEDDHLSLDWCIDDEECAVEEECVEVEPSWSESVSQELDTVADVLEVLDRLEETDRRCDVAQEACELAVDAEQSVDTVALTTERRWWEASEEATSTSRHESDPLACEAEPLVEAIRLAAEDLQQTASEATSTSGLVAAELVAEAGEVVDLTSCEDIEPVIASPSELKTDATQSDEPTEARERSAYVRTVLAVDDSPTVLKLVSMTLTAAGYEVVTAPNGIDAMKLLATMTPALVLLDVNMPRMDGYKLCKLLKSHDKTRFIPVVMLSGKDGLFDKLRGKLVGCDDYISKPFETAELVRHVARYVPLPSTAATH